MQLEHTGVGRKKSIAWAGQLCLLYDRIDWKKLMHALRRKGVDWKDRRLIGT